MNTALATGEMLTDGFVAWRAREFWRNEWTGKSFMAIGLLDPVLGRDAG
jgi:hypothetical protein